MPDTPSTAPPDKDPTRRPDSPTDPDGLVDVEVGRLRLTPAVADWVAAHLRRYAVNDWGYPQAIADLLTLAHHQQTARQETRDDRQGKMTAIGEALAARSPEQIHADEALHARLHLTFGMAEVTGALTAAHRLGLPVRWYIGDQEVAEVAAPQIWPHPRLDDPNNDLGG